MSEDKWTCYLDEKRTETLAKEQNKKDDVEKAKLEAKQKALTAEQDRLNKLKKDNPIITCCASGMRSASAKSILKSNGFTEVHNGGGWSSLQNKLNK
jgi:rhodanese-related sulfurtransferase